MKRQIHLTFIFLMFLLPVIQAQETTVPTFECIGIYWSPEGGSVDKDVLVKFRKAGTTEWHHGLNMKYNPIDPDYDGGDYRGSIVNLTPGTKYEIRLQLEGTDREITYIEKTWPEEFPVKKTYHPGNRSKQLTITESGTPEGYVVFDGQGDTIDVAGIDDACIHVRANYVIIRNYVLKNGKKYGVFLDDTLHDVVIERCDISNWGEIVEGGFGFQQAAVQSTPYTTYDSLKFNTEIKRIIVQRNRIHNPRGDANSWAEPNPAIGGDRHPFGPQAVMFLNSAGNHVIRYNEIWSDADHMYNDIIGYARHDMRRGFPGPDSDIYGNFLANCWDEPIEADGGGRNVRIWGNYMDDFFAGISAAENNLGPLYVWENVSARSYSPPGSKYWEYGMFFKVEYREDGYKYLFHNTILQPDGKGAGGVPTVLDSNGELFNMITRNNIFYVRDDTQYSIAVRKESKNNDFDYDLCNKPHPAEPHGLDGKPVFAPHTGFNRKTMTGNYSLSPESKGYDAGVVIPNFRETYKGKAPDMGASEAGGAVFEYGVNAYKNK